MILRIASPQDAAGVLAIYAPFVANTSLTFELEVPTVNDMEKRISGYVRQWPWIVCEDNGKIVAYSYASRYRERLGYQWSVECSVYVHEAYGRRGIAQRLYRTLFAILKAQGYRNVYAVINLPNEPSVAFHEKCGFTWFATYENVGYKLGKWKDVGWWRLILNEFSNEPAAPLKFSELPAETIQSILDGDGGAASCFTQ